MKGRGFEDGGAGGSVAVEDDYETRVRNDPTAIKRSGYIVLL